MLNRERSKSAKIGKKSKHLIRVGRPQTVKIRNNDPQVAVANRPFTALPNVTIPAKYIGLNPPKKANKQASNKTVSFTELRTKKHYWNDYFVLQYQNNSLAQTNRSIRTKIQSLEEQQKKYRIALELLQKSLKMDINPMSMSQLQIPMSIMLQKKIKDAKEKIEYCDTQMGNIFDKNPEELKKTQSHIDKLNRNLRNLKLNVEYRREIIKSLKGQGTELPPTMKIQQDIDGMSRTSKVHYMKFEDVSSKIKQEEFKKIQYTAELQMMPETIREIQEEIQRFKDIQIKKDKEILEYKKELGIDGDSEDEEENFDDSQDCHSFNITKKRQKILNKRIKETNVEKYELGQRIAEVQENIAELKEQVDVKKQETKNASLQNHDILESEKRDLEEQILKIKQGKLEQKSQNENASQNSQGDADQDRDDPAATLTHKKSLNDIDVDAENKPKAAESRVFVKKSRVTKKDIDFVSKSLSYHLRSKRIGYEEIFRNLERFIESCPDVSVINMIEFFKGANFDFQIRHPEEVKKTMIRFQDSIYLELLARYIIEDNYEDKVYYNENSTCQQIIVRSILKKLIGDHKIWNDEETEALHMECVIFTSKYENKLKDGLSLLRSSIGDYCERKDIKKTINDYQIPVTRDIEHFMILRLYEITKDQSSLKFMEIFQIFPPDPQYAIEEDY